MSVLLGYVIVPERERERERHLQIHTSLCITRFVEFDRYEKGRGFPHLPLSVFFPFLPGSIDIERRGLAHLETRIFNNFFNIEKMINNVYVLSNMLILM